ncbi:hypothetical protein IWX49DRAFT_172938 [Phyllosticta citricarpa]|uniref:Uncharacterized protein n=1 Tax=Phyllosticta paracitricarpa TaxID=2016321 RepID=A0ABR1N6V9_9PEZI
MVIYLLLPTPIANAGLSLATLCGWMAVVFSLAARVWARLWMRLHKDGCIGWVKRRRRVCLSAVHGTTVCLSVCLSAERPKETSTYPPIYLPMNSITTLPSPIHPSHPHSSKTASAYKKTYPHNQARIPLPPPPPPKPTHDLRPPVRLSAHVLSKDLP